jgi:hypothetical protein
MPDLPPSPGDPKVPDRDYRADHDVVYQQRTWGDLTLMLVPLLLAFILGAASTGAYLGWTADAPDGFPNAATALVAKAPCQPQVQYGLIPEGDNAALLQEITAAGKAAGFAGVHYATAPAPGPNLYIVFVGYRCPPSPSGGVLDVPSPG